MHSTPALTFDPAAAQAWLYQPSGTDGFTRAESLGIDEDLFGRGLEGFLATIDDLLTAGPDGLRRRADIGATQPATFTEQQVAEALNHAADDILDAVDAGDEGPRDGLNLLVNAAVAYLTGRAQNLPEVVEQDYDADYPTVLGWIEVAL